MQCRASGLRDGVWAGPGTCGAPDMEEVVVAAGRQLLPAGRPLEAAHLLLVAPQHACDVLADPAASSIYRQHFMARSPACIPCCQSSLYMFHEFTLIPCLGLCINKY